MNGEFIMQMRPLFGDEEKQALADYMDEDGFLTEFKRTEKFEQMIAQYTGAEHCVVVNNGTVSLTLAALALGIGPGDEVIVPNYTMIATPNSVKMLGAVPVFVDVEPETLCLDIHRVKQAVTSRTRAIMLVSANGRESRSGIDSFKAFARESMLPLIEDAAQSLGSYYSTGRHVGTEGVIGSFSFSAPKIISTGQGGALVTNDPDVARRIRELKDFGRANGGNDIHSTIGYNFKFTELQACVGIEQMKKLPHRVERKKEIWQKYANGLSGISGLKLFDANIELNTPWFIDALVYDRDALQNHLKANGIGTRTMYPPISGQVAYKMGVEGFPVATEVGQRGLWLPSQVQLTNDQIEYICQKIAEFYGER